MTDARDTRRRHRGPVPQRAKVAMKHVTSAISQTFNRVAWRPGPSPDRVPDLPPDAVTICAVADYGAATTRQQRIAEHVLAAMPEFVLTIGDNLQTRCIESEWQRVWDPPELFGRIRDRCRVWPILGNHDLAEGRADSYFARFPELNKARYYRAIDAGVELIALDSNMSLAAGSDQHAWLADVLSKPPAGVRIVMSHHPLLSGWAKKGGDERHRQIGHLLGDGQVSLVLVAHQHSYERSHPLNEFGTIQVTLGSGGHSVRAYMFSQPEWSAFRSPSFGHLQLAVGARGIVGCFIDERERIVDAWD